MLFVDFRFVTFSLKGVIQKIRVKIRGEGGGSSNLTQNVTVGEGGV